MAKKVEELEGAADRAVRRAEGTQRDGQFDGELVARVEEVLKSDPYISTRELSRRLGIHQRTARRYRALLERQASKVIQRRTGEELASVTEGLRAKVDKLTTRLEAALDQLFATKGESEPLSRNTAETVARLAAVLERYLRLRSDLESKFSPPKTNVYIEQLQQLFQQDREDPFRKWPRESVKAWLEANKKWGRVVDPELTTAAERKLASTEEPEPKGGA
jgi:hypothetical protein